MSLSVYCPKNVNPDAPVPIKWRTNAWKLSSSSNPDDVKVAATIGMIPLSVGLDWFSVV